METMPDVEAPDVRKPLDRIAGMGKDDAVEEGETPSQGILKGAPDQRAAVGLQMGLGQPGLLPRAEDPEGVGPGGDDELLRRIGTEGADYRTSMKASIRVSIWLSEKLRSSTMSASIISVGIPSFFPTIRWMSYWPKE